MANQEQRRPSQLRHKSWDNESSYADLSHPEWLDGVPLGFWNDFTNHKRYAQWLFSELGLKSIDDWHNVSSSEMRSRHGQVLIQKYNGYPNFLKGVYPTHEWQPWRFSRVPEGFWEDSKNQRSYLIWLGKRLGFKKPVDWYRIRNKDLASNFGITQINYPLKQNK